MPHGERWSPDLYLGERFPDATLIENVDLPPGVLGAVDHIAQVIYLTPGLDEVRRRSTLAFEIARLELGPAGADRLEAAMNREAAEWAARALIPIGHLCMAFAATSHLPARHAITEMARMLGVDEPTVRARRHGLTDDEQDAALDAVRGMSVVVV